MTLSELQSGRRVSPWVISLLCIAPWFAVRQEDLSLARGVVTLALVGFGVVTAYFYGALDVRGPRWSREMDRYLGTPIREALIPLAPSDLKLSEEERERLLRTEIYKELTGVFWQAVERNPVLAAQKQHFYSNGFLYSTALDVYILLRFFGAFYAIFAVILNSSTLFLVGLALMGIGFVTRSIGFSRARDHHLLLLGQQLDTLKSEEGNFVAARFRAIVKGWRQTGTAAEAPKTSTVMRRRLTVPDAVFVTALFSCGVFGAARFHWLNLSAHSVPAGFVRSAYISSGDHKKPIVVVFVHGVFGTTDSTWLDPKASSAFPILLANDPDLHDKIDVFTFEYFTPKFSTAPPIVDLADQLRGDLNDYHVFGDHHVVVFLAHSMGGIIVRAFLLSNQSRMRSVPLIFFYATPTNGADIAALAEVASANPQLRGMLPIEGNDLLQSIQSSWLNSDQARSIASYCGVEDLPTMGVMVVSRSSSTSLCNRPLAPLIANHIDIVKPVDRSDPRYTRFVTALHQEVLDGALQTKPSSNSNSPPGKFQQAPPAVSLTPSAVAACEEDPSRPYKCKSNVVLGRWMIAEAAKVSAMAERAINDVYGWRKEEPLDNQALRYSYEARIRSIGDSFSEDMMHCCMSDMEEFRLEALRRLDPQGHDPEEARNWEEINTQRLAAQQAKQLNPHIIPPTAVGYKDVSAYAPYMKKMGEQLKALKD
jgi:hypothetical protein